MDLATRLDVVSERVMREYEFMLSTFVTNFARVLDTDNPTSPAARHLLEERMHAATVSFLGAVTDPLKEFVAVMVRDAVTNAKAKLSDEKQAFLDDMVKEELDILYTKLIGAQFRDNATVRQALRHIALQVGLRTMRGRFSPVTALIQARRGQIANLKFVQADSSGRNWNSAVYVRTVVRQFFLLLYVESFLYGRVSLGSDLARVVYDDPEHAKHGLVFSITGDSDGYPTYQSIQEEIFHPNSVASVEAA